TPFSFDWSPVVRVLVVYALRYAAWGRREPGGAVTEAPRLEGVKPCAASSLSYALSKEVNWISHVFGSDLGGRPTLERLVHVSNPEGKRKSEPVVVRFREDVLSPRRIAVVAAGRAVSDPDEMEALADAIEETCKPKGRCGVLRIRGDGARDWNPEKEKAVREALAAQGVTNVTIVLVEEGSLKLTLRLRPDETARLVSAGLSGDV